MIGMCVSYYCTIDRSPGIDVEIALGAIQPSVRNSEQFTHQQVLHDYTMFRETPDYETPH
jgi:hypothetical protein